MAKRWSRCWLGTKKKEGGCSWSGRMGRGKGIQNHSITSDGFGGFGRLQLATTSGSRNFIN